MDSAVEMGSIFSTGKLQVRSRTWVNKGVTRDGARPELSERLTVVILEEIAGIPYCLEGQPVAFIGNPFLLPDRVEELLCALYALML